MGPLNVHVVFHLFHILIKMYLAFRVKVGLKKYLLVNFKPTCYLFFIILKFSKIYTQITINPMDA
jgi:hypothetical protein